MNDEPVKITVGITVVDALPEPSPLPESDLIDVTAGQSRMVGTTALSNTGSAGYAYVFCDSSLLEYQASIPKRAATRNQSSPFLSLNLPWPAESRSEDLRYIVKIPLANTIFVTGRDAVSIIVELEKRENGQSFQVVNRLEASAMSANWPFRDSTGDIQGGQITLTAPLVPLTAPRKIKSAFGNIVREITGPEGEDSAIPASSELEAAVTSFFEAINEPQSMISAWAVVGEASLTAPKSGSPGENVVQTNGSEDLRKLWTTSDNILSILPRLQQGARLHRILSGGGGWGKRAGLLSLDPDTSPVLENAITAPESSIVEDVLSSQAKMLGDVAKVGDSIQFFVLRTNARTVERTNRSDCLRSWSLDVGSIPSSIDQVPIAASKSNSNLKLKDGLETRYVADHFGALSESGFYLQIIRSSVSAGEQSSNISKVDVPFSHLSIIQTKPEMNKHHSTDDSICGLNVEHPKLSESGLASQSSTISTKEENRAQIQKNSPSGDSPSLDSQGLDRAFDMSGVSTTKNSVLVRQIPLTRVPTVQKQRFRKVPVSKKPTIRKHLSSMALDPVETKSETAADAVHHERTTQSQPLVGKVNEVKPRLRKIPTYPPNGKTIKYTPSSSLVRRVEVKPSPVETGLGDPFGTGHEADTAWEELTERSKRAINNARRHQRHREAMNASGRLVNKNIAEQVERLLEGFVP